MTGPWWSAQRIEQAAARCQRGKLRRPETIAFRMRHGEEVLALSQRLAAGTYRPGPGLLLATNQPKPREIHAAAYRDRVVHHLLHHLIEPRFEPGFIADSYACRRGKGTHAAALGLQSQMRCASRQGGRRVFALQMDICNYFASIHKNTLLALLAKGFSAQERAAPASQDGVPALWALLRTIVLHDPVACAQRRGAAADFARVPPHKRLGALGPERGQAIGNLTSQFFANVYLNALDQFVKRTLGVRHYVRYVDDFVLLDCSAAKLRGYEARIRAFLAAQLHLEAHPVPTLRIIGQTGVDFVGYIIRPDYLLPRRRVVRHMAARLTTAEAALRAQPLPAGQNLWLGPRVGHVRLSNPARWIVADEQRIERLRATWASYDGHLLKADATRLRARLWAARPASSALLIRRKSRVMRRFPLATPTRNYGEQVRRLRQGIGGAVLLVQVGAFIECTTRRDAVCLQLPWFQARKGRSRAGLPLARSGELIDRALAGGHRVAIALETGCASGDVCGRRLAVLLWPACWPSRPQRYAVAGKAQGLPALPTPSLILALAVGDVTVITPTGTPTLVNVVTTTLLPSSDTRGQYLLPGFTTAQPRKQEDKG